MNKYHAVKTMVEGITFDSKREADRYRELRLLENSGEISTLHCQVRYSLDVNGIHICNYVADFRYVENGREAVEDVKGVRTAVFRTKAKLMRAIYGIEVKET